MMVSVFSDDDDDIVDDDDDVIKTKRIRSKVSFKDLSRIIQMRLTMLPYIRTLKPASKLLRIRRLKSLLSSTFLESLSLEKEPARQRAQRHPILVCLTASLRCSNRILFYISV